MEEMNLDKTSSQPLVLTTTKTSDPQIKIEGPMVRQSKSDGHSSAQVSQSQASDVRKPRGECAMGQHQYEAVPRKVSNKLIQTEIEGCQVFYRPNPYLQQSSSENLPQTFRCKSCQKVLPRKKLCITVVIEEHSSGGPMKEVNCSETAEEKSGGMTFKLNSRCGKMCHFCHKHFPQKLDLAKHLITEHQLAEMAKSLRKRDRKKVLPETEIRRLEVAEADEESREWTCERVGCHQTFVGKKAYREHVTVYHKGKKNAFECQTCHKTFNHRGHLNKHKIIHTGEMPFMCSQCGRTFNQKANMEQHMTTHLVNPSSKKYSKVVMEGGDVEGDLKSASPKSYVCDNCGRAFYSLAGLQIHAKTHVTEKKSYPCPQCPEVFDKFIDLKFHRQGEHLGLKQWQCTVADCNKKCPSKSSFEEHMRIHTGERPHACHLCGKSFKQKSTLLGHYKNLHGPNPKKVKDKACPHCPQVFSSKHALNKHVKSHEAAAAVMELGTSQSVVDVKPPQEFIVITTLTDGQDVAITPAQVIPKKLHQHPERALSQPCDTSTNLLPPGFSFRPQNTNETKPSNS